MTKTLIERPELRLELQDRRFDLQELRRCIYRKAKSDKAHRFWGIFVHVAKLQTLEEAYRIAKRNGGAPGIDGQSFEDIEAIGVSGFLETIREELITGRYQLKPNRRALSSAGSLDRAAHLVASISTLAMPGMAHASIKEALQPVRTCESDRSHSFFGLSALRIIMKAACGKTARAVWAAGGGPREGDQARLPRPDTPSAGKPRTWGRGEADGR